MANGGGSSAVDSLEQLFVKANNDLTVVQHKLETEFEQKYPSNVNPLKLMSRIKKIQEELPSLKEQCQKLLEAKQVLYLCKKGCFHVANVVSIYWYINLVITRLVYGMEAVYAALSWDLIDKTQSTLVGNRALLQRMQTRANIPIISDSDDTVYTSLEKIIEEWNEQLGLKSNDTGHDNGSVALEDLNQKLFSSKIQNS